MRSINVSTEVFSAIWAARQPGEEAEDDILRRLLGVQSPESEEGGRAHGSGVHDRRYGVHFSEGFEIFRTYLGMDHRARATGGMWLLLGNGKPYSSLNELSQAIGAKTENAWINWWFSAPDGQQKPVSELRDPSKIRRRRAHRPWPISTQDL